MTFVDANCRGLNKATGEDPAVFARGQDTAGRDGIFGHSRGIPGSFRDRVIDTPISDEVVFGAASAGCRPVVGFPFADLLFTGRGALVNQITKTRHMAGGRGVLPVIWRGPDGVQDGRAAYPRRIEILFTHFGQRGRDSIDALRRLRTLQEGPPVERKLP
jgi:pyruvate dehydrogenase E1 component beta subunit